MPQQSSPRASRVPARMNRRPCWTLSSIGPMNGASTANGAIVIRSASAILVRAWSTRDAEEQGARQRHGDEGVADAAGGGQLDQADKPGAPGPGRPGQPVHDTGCATRRGRARASRGLRGRNDRASSPPGSRARAGLPHSSSILPIEGCDDPAGPAGFRQSPVIDACMPPDKEQSLTVSPTRTRTREPDEACAQAVDLARAAAQEMAEASQVGPHRGIEVDGERVVTHLFDCQDPAYVGWRWAITVARASRAKLVTVSEGVLLPGPDSLLAPDWVPWRDRVRPGDVGRGRPAARRAGRRAAGARRRARRRRRGAGLGRQRGLARRAGPAGRRCRPGGGQPASASRRWHSRGGQPPRPRPPRMPARRRSARACCRQSAGTRRPRGGTPASTGRSTPLAHAAPAPCATCGFLVRLGSPLGRVFGVCANEYAPDDGKVVSLDHGCGAHSEAIIARRPVRHRSPRSSTSSATTSSTRRASPWPRRSSSRWITPSRRARVLPTAAPGAA